MPSLYVKLPIETEPSFLAERAFAYLQARYPDWSPSDGQLDTWLISAIARQASELRDVASEVPAAIFRYFGEQLLGIPPIKATPATVLATVTMKDNVGYTLPARSLVAGIRDVNGVLRGFYNPNDIVIAPAATALANVPFIALEEGADSSGLGTNGTTLELVTSIERVLSVVASSATSSGVNEETDDNYLNRLAAQLTLQAPRPILPNDFAIFARNISGVARALALDGYDAVALTNNNARTITVAVMDKLGANVAGATKSAVQSYLTASREINFLVYVIDPTRTTIDVQWSVNKAPGIDTTYITTLINQRITDFMNPALWGVPPQGDQATWIQQTTVRFRDLIWAARSAEGVMNVNFVKVRTGAGAFLEQDITLTGPAPLPQLGTISGTVL